MILHYILLTANLLVCIALIAVVLMQRSEGGALGMGGGPSGFMSVRGAGDFLTRTTWILFGVFLALSLALTLLGGGSGGSVTDRLKVEGIDPTQLNLPPAGTNAVGTGQAPAPVTGAAPAPGGSILPAVPPPAAAPAPAQPAASTPASRPAARTSTPRPAAPAPTAATPAAPVIEAPPPPAPAPAGPAESAPATNP